MEKQTCKTCRHFCRHYTRSGNFWVPLVQGHCTYPHLKDRPADTPACQHYSPREGDSPPISLKGEFTLDIHDIPPELTEMLQKALSE